MPVHLGVVVPLVEVPPRGQLEVAEAQLARLAHLVGDRQVRVVHAGVQQDLDQGCSLLHAQAALGQELAGGDGIGQRQARIAGVEVLLADHVQLDRKSTRLNSSHVAISYAVFCLKKKKQVKNPVTK